MSKCFGCGSELHYDIIHQDKIGYCSKEGFNYCQRCFKLKHYGVFNSDIIPNNFDYLNIISKDDFLLVLIDSIELNIDILDHIKDYNYLIVLTKYDLINKLISTNKFIEYIRRLISDDDVDIYISDIINNDKIIEYLKNNYQEKKNIYYR